MLEPNIKGAANFEGSGNLRMSMGRKGTRIRTTASTCDQGELSLDFVRHFVMNFYGSRKGSEERDWNKGQLVK